MTLRNEPGDVHIAHRGTDTSGKKTYQDVTADLMWGLGLAAHDKNFRKRKNKTTRIIKSAPDDVVVTMSGHSYGGASLQHTLANSNVARKRVDMAHTFNTASHPLPVSQA